jgi:hypothetical protein
MKSLLPSMLAVSSVLSPLFSHAQCPLIQDCATIGALQEVCDISTNNPDFWNAVYWWDPQVLGHNLPESAALLSLSATDACNTGGLSFRYELFLDLDQDGQQETMVNSAAPPPAGRVLFNNVLNPANASLRVFDQRNISNLFKYRFALEVKGVGTTRQARVVWKSNYSLGAVLPQLPMGNHRIVWYVSDAQGNTATCERQVSVRDCQKPALQCQGISNYYLQSTGKLQLYVTDAIYTLSDNTTPLNQIKLGIRRQGTGTGFPVDSAGAPVTSVAFECIDAGQPNFVEVWALDKAGNMDFCTAQILIQDALSVCDQSQGPSRVCIEGLGNIGLEEAQFQIMLEPGLGIPPATYVTLATNACLPQSALNVIPLAANGAVTPVKDDNPLNGVTQYDGVLVYQHLSGEQPFTQPWQWIAADANRDNVVDSSDVETCKKLILGIYNELPNNTSWRFFPKNYVFPAGNPLENGFPESVSLATLQNWPPDSIFYFVGVKVCDLNQSALPNNLGDTPETRVAPATTWQVRAGEIFPNPTTGGASVVAHAGQDGTWRLELRDWSGRLISVQQGQANAGANLLDIPETALPQPGWYLWRLELPGQVFSGKLLKH